MLNEKPTFLSKIRTVSCGDILWAFFLPTMRIDIDVINVYHPARLCLYLTQRVTVVSTQHKAVVNNSFWDFQQNFYIWCGIFTILGGGGCCWDNPSFYHFFKKNFCQKVLWNFYSKFSKILSCRKFCLEISSLWLCKLDYFWFGFFLDSLFSIFHVMQVSVISSLFWFDSSFRLTLISAYSPSRCCSN